MPATGKFSEPLILSNKTDIPLIAQIRSYLFNHSY
jgi:hypothetical protein